MGGCQTAADGTVMEPKKVELGAGSKFKKLEKHKFDIPAILNAKLDLVSSSGTYWPNKGKITDYITQNSSLPCIDNYLKLDVGNNLDSDNKYHDSKFGNGPESLS